MTKFKSKKGIAALLATLTVVAISAIGAYAYFTNTGTGTGTATVGHSSAINLSNDAVGPLYPNDVAVPVTVHVANPGSGSQFVNQITGSVTAEGNAACLGSWFHIAPISYHDELAAGTSNDAHTTITMENTVGNQDDCQNATLKINWSSN